MPPQAVLFDLDGTLLDTLSDIAAAANAVLTQRGHAQRSREEFRRFVGAGVLRLFAQALAERATPDEVGRCADAFRIAYARQWNVQTRSYPDILELLQSLAERDVPLAVLSNKPHAFTLQCVAHYFPLTPFRLVLGEGPQTPPKPDPTGAVRVVRALGVPAAQVLYVGDTAIDMETAIAAGVRPIGVSWGFRDPEELVAAGAERVLARPGELLELLLEATGE